MVRISWRGEFYAMTFTGWKTRLNLRAGEGDGGGGGIIIDPEIDNTLTCVAVLDENDSWSDAAMDAKMSSFNANWPNRRFVLLVPNINTSQVYIPSSFYLGPFNGRLVSLVARDQNNSAATSDWWSITDMVSADLFGYTKVILLFVDNSGSMTTATVQASLKQFLDKAIEEETPVYFSQNGEEDWITPLNRSYQDFF